jgi:hypothetical protein
MHLGYEGLSHKLKIAHPQFLPWLRRGRLSSPACRNNKTFWRDVEDTAVKLYQKEQSKAR